MNRDTLEQGPCNSCEYEEGSIYCKEHCPHEAETDDLIKLCIEQERDCKTCIYSDKGHCAGTEKCHECMWESKYEQQSCEDAIYRQDVLDLAKKGVLISNGSYESVCKAINELPSVNPQPSGDAINREDALMCLTGEIKETDTIETIIARFARRIRKLSPVNPTKTGYWIRGKYKDTCSKCRCTYPKNIGFKNFCPNCGTKMSEIPTGSESQKSEE